jgi:hypothetical protein
MNNEAPLEKYHRFYRFVRIYSGTGTIKLEDGKSVDCNFECGQTEEGDIIICSRQYELFLEYIISGKIGGGSISHLSGYASNGQPLKASITQLLRLEASATPFVSFYARDLEVGTNSSVPLEVVRYYLVNFEFMLPITLDIGGYTVAINKIEGYDEADREIKATKMLNLLLNLKLGKIKVVFTIIQTLKHSLMIYAAFYP